MYSHFGARWSAWASVAEAAAAQAQQQHREVLALGPSSL